MSRLRATVSLIITDLFRSLTGGIVVAGAIAFLLVAILSVTGGVDRNYVVHLVGGFFGLYAMLLGWLVSDRTNRSSSYQILVRMPNRSMFLAAILIVVIVTCVVLELVVTVLSLTRLNEPIPLGAWFEIAPAWFSLVVFGATVGIHLSELVRYGWSRIAAYAALGFLLVGVNLNGVDGGRSLGASTRWLSRLSINPDRIGWIAGIAKALVWPISASFRVARSEAYSLWEGLAPALLIFAASLIFLLAVMTFDKKDLVLPED
ncbi:MAG: hypothetical protein ABFQ89_01345 [Chloroflexota bacterium]